MGFFPLLTIRRKGICQLYTQLKTNGNYLHIYPVRTLDTTYLHNGMILSTLGLSPHVFVFGLYPKRPHTNGDICPSLYTHDLPHFLSMWDFGRIPNNPPLEQRTIEPPVKWLSIRPLSTNQDSPLQCIGSTRLTWKHHLPRELSLTKLIHGSNCDITGAHHLRSAFRGFIHLTNFESGFDTTCKDSGHHISPQWYDIVHFGPKPSWICFWALPQKASYQWRYLSILIYPWSSPFLVNVGLWSYTQQYTYIFE